MIRYSTWVIITRYLTRIHLTQFRMSLKLLQSVTISLLCCGIQIALAADCRITCDNLSFVPSQWSYEGEDVPNLALKCSVQSDCHLDINYLLATQTTELLKRVNTNYLSVDVYFLCEHQSLLGEYHSTCMEGWYTSVTDLLTCRHNLLSN